MLIVDAANVVGSRPTGWWRDRPGAARDFVSRITRAVGDETLAAPVVIVLEGQARAGASEAVADGVEVVHAPGSGDDTITALATAQADVPIVVVTADRALRARVQAAGADVVGPGWLLERLPK